MSFSLFDNELIFSEEIKKHQLIDEYNQFELIDFGKINVQESVDEKDQALYDSLDSHDSKVSHENSHFDDIYKDLDEKDSHPLSQENVASGSTGTPLTSNDSSNSNEEINSDGSSMHEPTVQDFHLQTKEELPNEIPNSDHEDLADDLPPPGEDMEPQEEISEEVSDALYRLDRLIKGIIRGLIAVVLQTMRKEMKEYQKEHNKGKPNSQKINLKTNPSQFAKFFKWFLSDRLSLNLTQQAREDLYAVVVYLTFKTKFNKMIDPKLSRSKKQQIKREKEKFFRFNLPGNALGQDRDYAIAHVSVSFGKFLTEQNEEAKEIFWSKVMGRKNNKFDNKEKFRTSMSSRMNERVTPISEYLTQ